MPRVLITGAQGLLGSTLTPYLQTCGHEVLRQGRKGHVDVCVDLTDAHQLDAALDAVMPEVIVNLAAFTDVDECERNPQIAYLANVRIVENLARWIKHNGNHCHFAQLSTDHVYDGVGPHRESDVTLTNCYAFSKYAGELAAATIPSTVLRTNFFGPSQCPGRNSFSDWLLQSLTQGKPITVFDDVYFSPISMQRLAELIELVITVRKHGVFNVGSNNGVSKADFAYSFAQALDLPTDCMARGSSSQVKLLAYRPNNMCMDVSCFEDSFGIKLPTLADEIQSMRDIYAKAE